MKQFNPPSLPDIDVDCLKIIAKRGNQTFHSYLDDRMFSVAAAWNIILNAPRRPLWADIEPLLPVLLEADIDREYAENELHPGMDTVPALVYLEKNGEDRIIILDGWHRVWNWYKRGEDCLPCFVLEPGEADAAEITREQGVALCLPYQKDSETRNHMSRIVSRKLKADRSAIHEIICGVLDGQGISWAATTAIRRGIDPYALINTLASI